jgi:gliding motility-associated-like protein
MNPSFEGDTNIICAKWGFNKSSSGDIDLPDWDQLFSGDYYTKKCCCHLKYKAPRSGYGFTGIYVSTESFDPRNGKRYVAREYLIGKLSQPLVALNQYNVSFWVKPSGVIYEANESWTTSNISLAFVRDTSEIGLNPNFDPNPSADFFLRKFPEHITNHNGNIMDFVNYSKVEGCYTAKGGEQYIVIGNFRNDSTSTLVPLTDKTIPWLRDAYFLVDDVSVEKAAAFETIQDASICNGESLNLKIDTAIYKNLKLNKVLQSTPYNVNIASSGIYTLDAIQGNCSVHKELEISDYECNECNFYIPNVFSPNGDNINDEIILNTNCKIISVESQIFNRWGSLVAKSSDINIWNGTIGGITATSDVYVYYTKVNVQRENRIKIYELKGDITLIK